MRHWPRLSWHELVAGWAGQSRLQILGPNLRQSGARRAQALAANIGQSGQWGLRQCTLGNMTICDSVGM